MQLFFKKVRIALQKGLCCCEKILKERGMDMTKRWLCLLCGFLFLVRLPAFAQQKPQYYLIVPYMGAEYMQDLNRGLEAAGKELSVETVFTRAAVTVGVNVPITSGKEKGSNNVLGMFVKWNEEQWTLSFAFLYQKIEIQRLRVNSS